MVCPIPRSGRSGAVGSYIPEIISPPTPAVFTRFGRFKNWTLNAVANPEVRVYSGTRFGTQRIPGFVDWTGTFEGFGARPPLFVGDTFDWLGFAAPTTGVPCTPGCAYVVPAIVNTLSITWNFTSVNKGVMWSAGFQGTGTPTPLPNFDDPCDDTVFCDPNPCALVPIIKDPCAADAVVEFCNIVSVTLTFASNNIEYSNSSTNCEIRRQPGVLDFTLDIEDENPCIIPIMQKDYVIELPDSLTTKWVIKWAQNLGFSNWRVDAETASIIGKTNNFGMQAVSCCVPGTPVRGSIIDPAGVTVWPYATPV